MSDIIREFMFNMFLERRMGGFPVNTHLVMGAIEQGNVREMSDFRCSSDLDSLNFVSQHEPEHISNFSYSNDVDHSFMSQHEPGQGMVHFVYNNDFENNLMLEHETENVMMDFGFSNELKHSPVPQHEPLAGKDVLQPLSQLTPSVDVNNDDPFLALQEILDPPNPQVQQEYFTSEKSNQDLVPSEPHTKQNTDSKTRLRWSYELHKSFVNAVDQLGGDRKATPSAVLRLMNIKNVSLHHVKSHLQKYRLGRYASSDWLQRSKRGTCGKLIENNSSRSPSVEEPNPKRGRGHGKRKSKGKAEVRNEVEENQQFQREAEDALLEKLESERHCGILALNSPAVQAEDALLEKLESERHCGNLALNSAAAVLVSQDFGNETGKQGSYFWQELAGGGTMVQTPALFLNRKNTKSVHYSMERVKECVDLEMQRNRLKSQVTANYETEATSFLSVGQSSSSHLEGFSPLPEEGSKSQWALLDEDPIEAYLICDDSSDNFQAFDYSSFSYNGESGSGSSN